MFILKIIITITIWFYYKYIPLHFLEKFGFPVLIFGLTSISTIGFMTLGLSMMNREHYRLNKEKFAQFKERVRTLATILMTFVEIVINSIIFYISLQLLVNNIFNKLPLQYLSVVLLHILAINILEVLVYCLRLFMLEVESHGIKKLTDNEEDED